MKLLRRMFPVGTRSLLWGVHQFLWHPCTVYRAWCALYGRPTWREAICILIHDWGYWGCPNMDGPEGERHPELGAKLAGWLFGPTYHDLVLFHSRHYVKRANAQRVDRVIKAMQAVSAGTCPHMEVGHPAVESMLCWPDKLSHLYEPPWWYLLRARLSGELKEYRQRAADSGFIPLWAPDTFWFAWLQERLHQLAMERRGDAVPYNLTNGQKLSSDATDPSQQSWR